MGAGDNRTGELFPNVNLDARLRRSHPPRAIRMIVNEVLSALEPLVDPRSTLADEHADAIADVYMIEPCVSDRLQFTLGAGVKNSVDEPRAIASLILNSLPDKRPVRLSADCQVDRNTARTE